MNPCVIQFQELFKINFTGRDFANPVTRRGQSTVKNRQGVPGKFIRHEVSDTDGDTGTGTRHQHSIGRFPGAATTHFGYAFCFPTELRLYFISTRSLQIQFNFHASIYRTRREMLRPRGKYILQGWTRDEVDRR